VCAYNRIKSAIEIRLVKYKYKQVVTCKYNIWRRKPVKNTKGITLISLVITIIILIILAGVGINFAIGEKGIIKRAQEGEKSYTNATDYERYQLENLTQEMEDIINGGINSGTTSGENTVQRKDFTITTPYIGTSSVTVKVNTDTIQGNVKKYIYVVGEEVVNTTDTEVTIENLSADSNIDITVIAVTDTNKQLINTSTIKTEPRTYLYNNGDQCTQITGGWKAEAESSEQGGNVTLVVPNLTFNQDNMQAYVSSSSDTQGGVVRMNNNIDYSLYKKICITYTATLGRYASSTSIAFLRSIDGRKVHEFMCYYNAITNKTTSTFDISQSEDFCIYLQSYVEDGTASCNIYEVWLEK